MNDTATISIYLRPVEDMVAGYLKDGWVGHQVVDFGGILEVQVTHHTDTNTLLNAVWIWGQKENPRDLETVFSKDYNRNVRSLSVGDVIGITDKRDLDDIDYYGVFGTGFKSLDMDPPRDQGAGALYTITGVREEVPA